VKRVFRAYLLTALAFAAGLSVQTQPAAPSAIEIARLGPQVGQPVPAFSGVDQFGRAHTLESSLGPKGAMLVFFRSADW
jgi:hypothetical protein